MSIPLTDEAILARALLAAGVEVGHVGGDEFRRVVAQRLLASGKVAIVRKES